MASLWQDQYTRSMWKIARESDILAPARPQGAMSAASRKTV